jgi:hypothetical protein
MNCSDRHHFFELNNMMSRQRTACWISTESILSGFAYTLFERLRAHLKNAPFASMSAGTLRLKLIKVDAVIIRNTLRIRVLMSVAILTRMTSRPWFSDWCPVR